MVRLGRIRATGRVETDGEIAISVVRRLAELSQNQARRLFELGKVYAGRSPCLDWRARLSAGTLVSIDTDRKRASRLVGLEENRIIHVDSSIVVVDKPTDIVSVPPTRTGEPTLLDLLAEHLAPRPGSPRLVPLHRLDRETCGLMLFGIQGAHLAPLRRQVESHAMERAYYAVVHGQMESCTLSGPIDVTRRKWSGKTQVRYAETCVVALRRGPGVTLVDLRPNTGRFHQLRIQLAAAGHPIVGDRQHLGARGAAIRNPQSAVRNRLALQSFHLSLVHPETGKTMSWTLTLDAFLEGLLSNP